MLNEARIFVRAYDAVLQSVVSGVPVSVFLLFHISSMRRRAVSMRGGACRIICCVSARVHFSAAFGIS